jgi:clan AA aspartic protease (TIGR02281 family)
MRGDFFEPERGGGVMGWALRQLMFWLVGGLVVYLIIANRGLLTPHADGGTAPPAPVAVVEQPSTSLTNSLILHAASNGYVFVDASINGSPIHMAFDTAATMVSLTQADAARIGIAGSLNYTIPFGTANGRSYGAPVTLREIRIGQLEIDDVKAVVMPNLKVSLLGQTFLSRLDSYQMRDGVLTLTW